MTVLFHQDGPLVRYDGNERIMEISDLNPEVNIRWRVSRFTALKAAYNLFWAAVLP